MTLFLRLVILAFLLSISASAQRGAGGAIDPFFLGQIPAGLPTPCTSPASNGATLRAAQTLDAGVRNLVIITAGQSNITDTVPGAYSPANPSKIDNFNVYDGATYAAIDPLLGTSCFPNSNIIGHPILRLADVLITNNKFDRVVIAPLAIGSTSVAQWATGPFAQYIPKMLGRLAARGMVAGTNITVIILWGQGETDTAQGTSQSDYTTALNLVISNSRTAGFTGRWFVAKETWDSTQFSTAIQAAQAAVVNHGSSVWAGADADSFVGAVCGGLNCRNNVDNLHWSAAGSPYYAGQSGSAGFYQALVASGAPF